MDGKQFRWRFGDTVLVLAVAAVAAALLIWLLLRPDHAATVQVTVDGVLYATLPLDTDTVLDIPSADGGCNRLVIADGAADMTLASCPDGICINHVPIFREGQSIICLPNKVVVTVVGGGAAVDAEV